MNLHGLTIEQLECARGWSSGADWAREMKEGHYVGNAPVDGKWVKRPDTAEERAKRNATVESQIESESPAFQDGARAALAHFGWVV